MPVVKPYEETVAQKPLPGFRQESVASPALMSGAFDSTARLSQGAMDAGTGASAVAFKMQEREDVDAIYRAETKLKEDYLTFDTDVKQNRKGDYAKGVAAETRAWWDENARKHIEGLKNDNQRRLFINRTSGLRLQSLERANSFEREQTDIAQEQSYKANKVAEVNIAANDPTDAAIVAAKDNIKRMNRERAVAKGWSTDFLNGVDTEDLTRLHDQVIERLIGQNRGDEAKAYFDRYSAEITSSETKTKLEKMSSNANAAITSVRAAGEIYSPSKGLDVMEDEARAKFEKQPETLKMVIANLRERRQATKEGEATRVSAAQAPLTLDVMKGMTPSQLNTDPRFTALSAMGEAGAERAATLMKHAQSTLEHKANLANAQESRAYTATLRQQAMLNVKGLDTMMRLSDPTVLSRMQRTDVINLAPMIGNDNATHLLSKWDSITKSGTHLQEAKLDDDAFKSFAKRAGLDPFAKDETSKQAIVDTRNRLERVIISEQVNAKRPLSRAEKDAIIEREIKNTVTTGWIFKSQTPAIALNPEVAIPPADYRRIESDIRADGRHLPSPDNVMRVWVHEQNKAKSKDKTVKPEGSF